jgi:hypothetical protein
LEGLGISVVNPSTDTFGSVCIKLKSKLAWGAGKIFNGDGKNVPIDTEKIIKSLSS